MVHIELEEVSVHSYLAAHVHISIHFHSYVCVLIDHSLGFTQLSRMV